jgi:transposase InsO family protein
MITRPDLTDAEVDDLCSGLRQNAAKARYLRELGLTVNTRPNGRPLVMRAHAEQVLAGQRPASAANDTDTDTTRSTPTPNRAALIQLYSRKAA